MWVWWILTLRSQKMLNCSCGRGVSVPPTPYHSGRVALDDVGFHGDPDRFDFKDPFMSYSYATVGPAIQLNFTPWLHLRVEGGYTLIRNFSLFDGPKEEGHFGMESAFYLRAGT